MKQICLHITSALMLFATAVCGGCADDIARADADDEGKFIISVALSGSVSDATATRAGFDNFDNEDDKWGVKGENIETLRIIIVAGDGIVEHNFHVTADNATLLGEYTFNIKDNDTKTVILVANEEKYSVDVSGMEIAGGIRSLSHLLSTRYMPGAEFNEDEFRGLTVALQHNSLNDAGMSFDTPLLISAIYHEAIPDLSDGTFINKEYVLHRAAVKYSFRIINQSKYAHKLDAISIDGITDREFLVPDATYGDNNEVLHYNTPSTAIRSIYKATLQTPLSLPENMTQGVEAIPSFYVPEGIPSSDVMQKVSISLDGAQLSEWKELQWLMPGETEATPRPMADLPRNSHVIVNITVTDTGIKCVADVQPYSVEELYPWFGLDRDSDGNIITERYDDGTYDVIVDGSKIRKEADGDIVIRDFSDGSLFCKAIIYKDYIHDDNEIDYEYPYEKDYSGGNMIIMREKSSGGTYHGTGDNEEHHDHGNDDRAKFVLGDDNEFYRCDWSKTDEDGHPVLSRYDSDGALIVQCNGYQFRIIGTDETTDDNILNMQKYIGTYLVLTDPDDPESEELRYYLETYTQEHKGLVLDMALGINDPDFRNKYPLVFSASPTAVKSRKGGSQFIKATGSARLKTIRKHLNR